MISVISCNIRYAYMLSVCLLCASCEPSSKHMVAVQSHLPAAAEVTTANPSEMTDISVDTKPSKTPVRIPTTTQSPSGSDLVVKEVRECKTTTQRVLKRAPSQESTGDILQKQSSVSSFQCDEKDQLQGAEITRELRQYIYRCIMTLSDSEEISLSYRENATTFGPDHTLIYGSPLIPLISSQGRNAAVHACFESAVANELSEDEERLAFATSRKMEYIGSSNQSSRSPNRRTRWLSDISGIEPLVDSRFFLAYNPQIFPWFGETMIPSPSEMIGSDTAQHLYDEHLQRIVRGYAESLYMLRRGHVFDDDIEDLSRRLFTSDRSPSKEVSRLSYNYRSDPTDYIILKDAITESEVREIVRFWTQTHLDGSADEVWGVMQRILAAYDPGFLNELNATYEFANFRDSIDLTGQVLTETAVSDYFDRENRDRCVSESNPSIDQCVDVAEPSEQPLPIDTRDDILNCAYGDLDTVFDGLIEDNFLYTYMGVRHETMRLLSCIQIPDQYVDDGFHWKMNLKRFGLLSGLPIATDGGLTLFDRARSIFRRFNPALIRWAIAYLMPSPDDLIGDHPAQWYYDTIYRRFVYTIVESYLFLHTKCDLQTQVDQYRSAMKAGRDGLNYLQEVYLNQVPDFGADDVDYEWSSEMAIGFWLRREMDKTTDVLWDGLTRFLKRFDPDYFNDLSARLSGDSAQPAEQGGAQPDEYEIIHTTKCITRLVSEAE